MALPRPRAELAPAPEQHKRSILLALHDSRKVEVPADEPIVYFAEAYTDSSNPNSTHVYVSASRDSAWAFVRTTISIAGGYGHVLVYDVTILQTPRIIRCLGRIDTPTQEPVLP